MRSITLDDQQRNELVSAFKSTTDKRLRERCQAVLMTARGGTQADIAATVCVSARTVRRFVRQYRQQGLAGLAIRWGPGQRPRIPASLAPTVQQWIVQGPVACGRLRANWTYAELAEHLHQQEGIRVSRRAVCNFAHRHGIRPYRPTYRFLRGDPEKQRAAQQQLQVLRDKAAAEELVLLSQDEARFPLVPTLVTTLGLKGHRPTVGTWDNKDQVYAFASVNCTTGKLTRHLMRSTAAQRRRKTISRNRRMQRTFARHLLDVGRVYPSGHFPRVVVTVDNAPWHRGPRIRQALSKVPHVELFPLPSYSPHLNVVERVWKLLRQRATHNRLFADAPELQRTLAQHLSWLQVHREQIRTVISAPS